MSDKNPKFPNWNNIRDHVYRRCVGGRIGLVGRFDGQNWGYLVMNDRGEIMEGKLDSNLSSLFDAIDEANTILG